jgi:DinB superfamily
MLESAIQVNLFLMQYCQRLVGDIADLRLAEQPVPGVNHPAWVLGHLAWTADRGLERLGASATLAPEWTTLFGRGSTPSSSRNLYASREELLRALERGYEQLRQRAASASPEQLSQPTTDARAETLPTLNDLIAFVLTGHVGVHLGQISAWRRMIGLPPLF